jgi:hypothetical protein
VLLLALVSPIIVLGFLFLMQGFERWMLGAEPVTVRARPMPARADRDANSNRPRDGAVAPARGRAAQHPFTDPFRLATETTRK